jgi:NAD(P)-dependent dehydrogenase (short-subunit alcohol dehydrogenase family)
VVAEIEAMGRRALALRADVSDAAQVQAAVALVGQLLGTITAVANVAGGSGPGFGLGPLVSLPEAEFRRVLDVNLVGTWLVCRACAAAMVADGLPGRICNVSSQAGRHPLPLHGAYCVAKAGVVLLTRSLAAELLPSRIAVNAVCPATLERDLPGAADEAAATICWLLSDEAAAITGEALDAGAGPAIA